ncbi:MAG: hypothetical protein KAU03_05550, partial [Candidatus Altiarchaeales archaeon]|nr:hypothetical protein [Candidatus Altiarchaeales archaeon]
LLAYGEDELDKFNKAFGTTLKIDDLTIEDIRDNARLKDSGDLILTVSRPRLIKAYKKFMENIEGGLNELTGENLRDNIFGVLFSAVQEDVKERHGWSRDIWMKKLGKIASTNTAYSRERDIKEGVEILEIKKTHILAFIPRLLKTLNSDDPKLVELADKELRGLWDDHGDLITTFARMIPAEQDSKLMIKNWLQVQLKEEEGHLHVVLATEDQIGSKVSFVPTEESKAKLRELAEASLVKEDGFIPQNAFLFGYRRGNEVQITDIVSEEELRGYGGVSREDSLLNFIHTRFSREKKSLQGIIHAHPADSQILEGTESLRDHYNEEIRELMHVDGLLHQPGLIGIVLERKSEVLVEEDRFDSIRSYIFRNIYDKEEEGIVENTAIAESVSVAELLKEPDDFVKEWLDGLRKSDITIEKAEDESLPQEAVERGAEGYYIDLKVPSKKLFSTGTLGGVGYLTIGSEEEWSRGLLVVPASSNIPLGTDKVATCTGLALKFRRGGESYIALTHIAVNTKSESYYSYNAVKAILKELRRKGGIEDVEVVIYHDPINQYMPEEFIRFELSPWVRDIRFVQRVDSKANARILVDDGKVRILSYHDRKLIDSKVVHFSDGTEDVGEVVRTEENVKEAKEKAAVPALVFLDEGSPMTQNFNSLFAGVGENIPKKAIERRRGWVEEVLGQAIPGKAERTAFVDRVGVDNVARFIVLYERMMGCGKLVGEAGDTLIDVSGIQPPPYISLYGLRINHMRSRFQHILLEIIDDLMRYEGDIDLILGNPVDYVERNIQRIHPHGTPEQVEYLAFLAITKGYHLTKKELSDNRGKIRREAKDAGVHKEVTYSVALVNEIKEIGAISCLGEGITEEDLPELRRLYGLVDIEVRGEVEKTKEEYRIRIETRDGKIIIPTGTPKIAVYLALSHEFDHLMREISGLL